MSSKKKTDSKTLAIRVICIVLCAAMVIGLLAALFIH